MFKLMKSPDNHDFYTLAQKHFAEILFPCQKSLSMEENDSDYCFLHVGKPIFSFQIIDKNVWSFPRKSLYVSLFARKVSGAYFKSLQNINTPRQRIFL